MTLRFLLDTTIVSAPIAPQPNRKVVKKLEQHGALCALPAPVWHELVYGCSRLPIGKRRAALEDYLTEVVERSFVVLPYDAAAASLHGRERARLERTGQSPPFVDGQIAAIAMAQELALVTANVKDFGGFQGLEVVDWSR